MCYNRNMSDTFDPSPLQDALPQDETLFLLSDFFKTIGDPTRLKILFSLSQRELTVHEISEVTRMSDSAVSHQLAALKRMGLAAARREGKNMIYRLDDSHVHGIIQLAKDHLSEPRSLL